MTKEALWEIFISKNPNFVVSGGNFTAKGLKQFFDQVWKTAHEQGFENGKAYEKLQTKNNNSGGYGDLFNGIFGKK